MQEPIAESNQCVKLGNVIDRGLTAPESCVNKDLVAFSLEEAKERLITNITSEDGINNCDRDITAPLWVRLPSGFRIASLREKINYGIGNTVYPVWIPESQEKDGKLYEYPKEYNKLDTVIAYEYYDTKGVSDHHFFRYIEVIHCNVDGNTYYVYNLLNPTACPVAYVFECTE